MTPFALSRKTELLLPILVALLGLSASLGLALLAAPDSLRVAVLVLPGMSSPWAAIDRSGLPVVQVMLHGTLVVVDGKAAPDRLNVLRDANLVLLDAARVPGCADPAAFEQKEASNGPDT
ncbi:MAG: hypothetical protein ACOH2H_12145 [Cypionkella sp.]